MLRHHRCSIAAGGIGFRPNAGWQGRHWRWLLHGIHTMIAMGSGACRTRIAIRCDSASLLGCSARCSFDLLARSSSILCSSCPTGLALLAFKRRFTWLLLLGRGRIGCRRRRRGQILQFLCIQLEGANCELILVLFASRWCGRDL